MLIGFKRAGADLLHATGDIHELAARCRPAGLELVIQAFISEVAIGIGNPLLQPTVRLYDEFRHAGLLPKLGNQSTLDPRYWRPDQSCSESTTVTEGRYRMCTTEWRCTPVGTGQLSVPCWHLKMRWEYIRARTRSIASKQASDELHGNDSYRFAS